MKGAPICVLIVDDHEGARIGIEAALKVQSPSIEVGHAAGVQEAIRELDRGIYDVAVLDYTLEDGKAAEVASFIAAESLDTRCVVLTSSTNPVVFVEMFNTGVVDGFQLKTGGTSEIVEAVLAAAKGFSTVSIRDVRAAEQKMREYGLVDRSKLTERENTIVNLVADGASDSEIAGKIFVAPATVRNILSGIYRKLDIPASRQRLAAMVMQETFGV